MIADTIFQMFTYTFMVRAIIVGILVSLCSALLGVSLVLKKYSMIGDGLSHVSFGALALATSLGLSPLKFTVPVVVVAAILLLRVNEKSKFKGDSAIGIISVAALAFGVISIKVTGGLGTDLYNYLFGSILAMTKSDVTLSIILSVIVLSSYVILYNKIFAVTFDENFSRACGTKVDLYNTLIAILTAVTIVLGMRMMGTLIISALIIFPAVTAMRLFKSFKSVAITSALLSVTSFVIAFFASYIYDLPTGATIVAVDTILLIIFIVIEKIKRVVNK